MADFWQRIKKLYREKPRVVPIQRRVAPPAAPIPSAQPAVPPPVEPLAGPLDAATKIDIIHQAGQQRRLLEITYEGLTRLVEPYSFRQKWTGNRLFFGWCMAHNRIHSFIVEKISNIKMTEQRFSPRWEIEL